MCLIAVSWKVHPDWPLVLLANRDEWRARPTAALHAWDDQPGCVGGRDLQAGGSWLMLSERRRLAAVTNIRRPGIAPAPRSRGALVRDFVGSDLDALQWAERLRPRAAEYAAFNLLLWDGVRLVRASMDGAYSCAVLAAGHYGISNGPADPPWAKALRPLDSLDDLLGKLDAAGPAQNLRASAWSIMRDTTVLPDAELPRTGLDLERERWLSSAFIEGEAYGTRSTAFVLAGTERWWFAERRFDASPEVEGESESTLEGRWRSPG